MSAIPDVSVVISCRNREAMLWDCFLGLGAQTLPRERFEVVLMDNVSTDDLARVAERARRELGLAVTYERMETDNGPAPARNRGVGLARAPVIAFTDSDCRPDPGWLAAGLAAFDDPAVALASGPVLPKPGQPVTLTSKLSFVTATEHPSFPTANAWYRREVFRAHGGFDTALCFSDPFGRSVEAADTDLAWRVIEAGHARRFVPEAVMRHEVERLGPIQWLTEPTRIFPLPGLIRRHPQLRDLLLTGGYVFYPRATIRVVAVTAWLLACLVAPWLLPAGLAALLALAALRARSLDPRRVWPLLVKFAGETARHFMLVGSLLYGSIRFRTLVI